MDYISRARDEDVNRLKDLETGKQKISPYAVSLVPQNRA